MSRNSNTDQQRRAKALPLSKPMVELLGAMMTIIDKRAHMLTDGTEEKYDTETCAACCGAGFLLIPIESLMESFIQVPDTEDEDEDEPEDDQ
ncbi:hypothetical protein NMY22_g17153 [Coprinellus aureogranulatus]|nr:hypothetical protein NMY22_g17153 [Coprinellus aureogranulatus]